MANSWDNCLLPPGYAYGFSGGPAFDTRIVRMDGGGEQRVQSLEEPRWRWSALRKNFGNGADVSGLVSFFLARRGALYGFLFVDPADRTTNANGIAAPTGIDQVIGIGDGTRTRFTLRKQYTDPGGMTARTYPRKVVPILGTASAALARLLGVDAGANIAPVATVAGTPDAGATFLPLTQAVELSSAPAPGAVVQWGGYFAVPARFADVTDKGMEATITGFLGDEAPFEIDGLSFDDPVPTVPGGAPYGYELLSGSASSEVSARGGFYKEVPTTTTVNLYLDDLINYPTGGPHMLINNTGAFTATLYNSLGGVVGTIPAGTKVWLFVKDDGSGNRSPVIF
ncbi:MAG: DUF2460 domain-containing protein [Planctomycetota bacterium]